MSFCPAVAGGEDSRAQIIRGAIGLLRKERRRSLLLCIQPIKTHLHIHTHLQSIDKPTPPWGAHTHTLSEASICDVSEQLKQEGGSSRGSGDGVWMAVPITASSQRQHVSCLALSILLRDGSRCLTGLRCAFNPAMLWRHRRVLLGFSSCRAKSPISGETSLKQTTIFVLKAQYVDLHTHKPIKTQDE